MNAFNALLSQFAGTILLSYMVISIAFNLAYAVRRLFKPVRIEGGST